MTTTTPYRKTEITTMSSSGTTKLKLIQEALSRARMRRPQADYHPEAHRPARQIAMSARHRTASELGGRL
ncbi:hypothetical protein [Actinoplanes sp. NPDC051859]|uniref:hypothetical protein n=1 Tax=Actinoplanes sp. NPDC051859 TaxID=3363909 RepID=UPI003792A548